MRPVSYTHLDVYKRQPPDHAALAPVVLDHRGLAGATVVVAVRGVAHVPGGFGNHPHLARSGERIEPLGREFAGRKVELLRRVAGLAGQDVSARCV